MANASSEHRPKRILKFSATLLVLALLAYAAFLVSQSWRETKSDQSIQLATIADLSANAIDMYFTQLEIGMQNLGADLPKHARTRSPISTVHSSWSTGSRHCTPNWATSC